jgi:hypothetical protein
VKAARMRSKPAQRIRLFGFAVVMSIFLPFTKLV